MPSWNIHTAHAERLLRELGADAIGVADPNAFLFGNLLPDVYVGYMVPGTTRLIDYTQTHLASPGHIPLPDHDLFWGLYVEGRDDVTDVVLGAWAHLACDHVYNACTRAFLCNVRMRPGETARERKQADFALFGRTLDISMQPRVDEALLAQCAAFPQYRVEAPDVRAAVDVERGIVCENRREHVDGEPSYALLTDAFFSEARERAHQAVAERLLARASSR